MLSLFKKILAPGESRTAGAAAAPREAARANSGDPVKFVEFVVCCLVDDVDAVQVSTAEKNGQMNILISCAKPDRGKVIGKNGKTISAIRTLAAGAGGRSRRRIGVELVE